MSSLCAEINNGHSTYIFCGIYLLCNFQYRNRARSITLIPFEIMSQNLVEIYSMSRRCAAINNGHSTYIFFGIIPLCKFPYRNRVRSITLIPFKIISRNLAQLKSMTRRRGEINSIYSTYIFAELFPFVIFSIEIVSGL